MTGPSLVSLMFFAAAALLVAFVYRYYSQDYTAKRKVNRRLSLIEKTADPKEVLTILRRERGIFAGDTRPWLEGLQTLFVQSGLHFEGIYFLSVIAGLSTVITTAITIAFGFHLINLVSGLVSSMILVLVFVWRIRNRRILRFTEQLPEVLDIIVRSLKAGHPLPISLALVAREMPDPAGTEFGIASDEVTYGLALPAAMQNLSLRVGDPDSMFLVMATSVQMQTGGNLSDILTRLSKLIRDRFRLRRRIRALSSEGRVSAVVLTVLPIVLFGVLSLVAPTYFGDVWDNLTFRIAMAVAGVMLLIGCFVMTRMVNFKY
jgi:tight adherence protein B